MPRSVRLTISAAVLILLLAACGVEVKDSQLAADTGPQTNESSTTLATTTTAPETTTTTEPETTTTGPEGPVDPALEPLIQTYEDLGLDPKDARCVAAAVTESYGDLTSNADVLDLLEGCNLTAGDLAEIGSGFGTPEEAIKKGIVTSMKNIGLDDEQANCVADAYVKKFGTDIAPSQDSTPINGLFEDCDVSASDVNPGG